MKKIISLFLAILMVCSIFSISNVAFAENGICQECRETKGDPETHVYKCEQYYVHYHHILNGYADDFGCIEVDWFTSSQKNLVLPDNINGDTITRYSASAFEDNGISETETLTVPEGVISVDYFTGKSLKTIYLPASLQHFSSYAFTQCKNLEKIVVSKDNKWYKTKNGVLFDNHYKELIAYPANKPTEKYTIPDTVNTLKKWSFYRTYKLKEVVIPASVKYLCYSWENPINVFGDSKAIEKFTVSKDNKNFSSKDGVLFNKDKTILYAYPAKKASKSYTIPKTVKRIGPCAFSSCSKLKTLKFSKNLKRIDYDPMRDFLFNACKITNVYYSGSKSDWNKIYFIDNCGEKIAYSKSKNFKPLEEQFKYAKIHYNAKI